MANFNKAFNFRGGFQVDTDVFIVRGQNVGIGSTIPNERLVVDGRIQADSVGVNSISVLRSDVGILTVTESLDVGIETGSGLPFPLGVPQVRITTGVITAANPAIGLVTYYGDGGQLLNLPTSQWIDIDVGLGYTSIYSAGNVGVDTVDPRFAFQVGGVPFNAISGLSTDERGVGIDTGSIWATDDITLGGKLVIGGDIELTGGISIGGTLPSAIDGDLTVGGTVSIGSTLYVAGIVTAQEFAGIGSQITLINADNIGLGSISSDRYGDLIVTKEVIADRFIGTATSAEDLTSDAQISIDTIEANVINAIDRFTTLTGNITVGHNDSGLTGDIDLRKTAADSTIYSLTDPAFGARVFVGHEREESNNNGFAGIRFGGNAASAPLSGLNDLDLVNFDVGNVNFYLHEGNPSTGTSGRFRWINGQLDIVLADLSKDGGFTLAGNGNPLLPTFEVSSGFSTFKGAATFDTTVDVVGNATFGGDVNVVGEISFGSILFDGPVQVPSLLVDTTILLGSDPTVGGTGVLISSNGTISGSNSFTVGSSIISTSGINANNINSTTGTLGSLTSTNITAGSIFSSGNNFSILSNGSATFDSVTVNSLSVPTISIANLTADTLTANFDISSPSGTITTINSSTINTDTINANGIDVVNLDADNLSCITLAAQGSAQIAVDSDINLSNNVLIGAIDGGIGSGGVGNILFFTDSTTLTIVIRDPNFASLPTEDQIVGTVTLPYDPSP